jgi:xanthine dehydrogenase YagT iron-sulfur-binding subunit
MPTKIRGPRQSSESGPRLSRRGFLAGSAGAGSALALNSLAAEVPTGVTEPPADGLVQTTIRINGTEHALTVDSRTTVLDLLREDLDLSGTKVGCNHGQCGACTVLLEGVRVNSCFVLAAAADGKSVVTIEGLAGPDSRLHPMQTAFIENDAFQCGYCTPGQIVSAIGCVMEGHAGSDTEIREYMSGNLCRCGAYNGIVEAITQAREDTEKFKLTGLAENRP